MNEKSNRVATLLFEHRRQVKEGFWPRLRKGPSPSMKDANKFLLGCILNYQIKARLAWENADRLAEDILGDPDELWHRIVVVSLEQWNDKRSDYRLHRFPVAHERVWRIATAIVAEYGGDARRIWEKQSADVVLKRLKELGVGTQISRMTVGALCDTGQIDGVGDVKVDLHVRRVLGRVLIGRSFALDEEPDVIRETRRIYPENPWLLDEPLYTLGKTVCRPTDPICDDCYLRRECVFFEYSLST